MNIVLRRSRTALSLLLTETKTLKLFEKMARLDPKIVDMTVSIKYT